MSHPTNVLQQQNYMPAFIAALIALVIAIPLTIFATILLLRPSFANAGEFNQNANTGVQYVPVASSVTGNCNDESLEVGEGSSVGASSALPTIGSTGSITQNQSEDNSVVNNYSYIDSFNTATASGRSTVNTGSGVASSSHNEEDNDTTVITDNSDNSVNNSDNSINTDNSDNRIITNIDNSDNRVITVDNTDNSINISFNTTP
ncbi:MAG: hypothetical protein M3P98_00285 [bacterium]|nr:hypothetical protein [bacterium]